MAARVFVNLGTCRRVPRMRDEVGRCHVATCRAWAPVLADVGTRFGTGFRSCVASPARGGTGRHVIGSAWQALAHSRMRRQAFRKLPNVARVSACS
jgi:hypothetical protein